METYLFKAVLIVALEANQMALLIYYDALPLNLTTTTP